MKSWRIVIGALGCLAMVGCETPATTGQWDPSSDPSYATALKAQSGNGILLLLNDSHTTVNILDDDVGLDARAAKSLMQHRNGWDMTYGTEDDNLFDSIQEVDSVSYVGPVALTQLKNFALYWGWEPEQNEYMGTWSGVSFTWNQADITLAFVNGCSIKDLDVDLGLDHRAARNIVLSQPIFSINQLSNIQYVGQKTLKVLRDVSVAFSGVDSSAVQGENSLASEEGDMSEGGPFSPKL